MQVGNSSRELLFEFELAQDIRAIFLILSRPELHLHSLNETDTLLRSLFPSHTAGQIPFIPVMIIQGALPGHRWMDCLYSQPPTLCIHADQLSLSALPQASCSAPPRAPWYR